MNVTLAHDGTITLPGRVIRPGEHGYSALLSLYHRHESLSLSAATQPGYPATQVCDPGYGGHPWLKGTPDYAQTYDVPVEHIHVDPEKYQYKRASDPETGITRELDAADDEQFDPDRMGTLLCWKDKEGRTCLVDGHHRFHLAKRAEVETVPVQYIKAGSAAQARAIGAHVNGHKEGTGLSAWEVRPHENGYGLFREGKFEPVALSMSRTELEGRIAGNVSLSGRKHKSASGQGSLFGETAPASHQGRIWDESKESRAADGKWTEGAGGHAEKSSENPSTAVDKPADNSTIVDTAAKGTAGTKLEGGKMVGSEKQIKWATDIKSTMLAEARQAIEELSSDASKYEISAEEKQELADMQAGLQYLESAQSAKSWIDGRGKGAAMARDIGRALRDKEYAAKIGSSADYGRGLQALWVDNLKAWKQSQGQ